MCQKKYKKLEKKLIGPAPTVMEGLEELLIGHILRLCSPSNRDRAEGLEQIVQISNEYKPEPGEIGLDGILKDFTFLKDDASPLIRKVLFHKD